MTPSVFLSYSHEDIDLVAPIKFVLDELQRDDRISVFHDGEIRAGELWDAEIERHLRTATHVLLAISDDFIKSDYVRSRELPIIRGRANSRAVVIPLLIRGQNWRMFLEGDSASFIKAFQLWPVVPDSPTSFGPKAFACLSEKERFEQLKVLRSRLIDRVHRTPPPPPGPPWEWIVDDEKTIRANLAALAARLPDRISVGILNVTLPAHLAGEIAYSEIEELVGHANEILYEIDEVRFAARKVPEPQTHLAGQEESFWAEILLDLASRSPLSIMTLLILAYPKAPGVLRSIESIATAGDSDA